MHLVPPTIPETLAGTDRAKIIGLTSNILSETLAARLGAEDVHGLGPEVVGRAMASLQRRGQGGAGAFVESAVNAMIADLVGPQVKDLQHIYQFLSTRASSARDAWVDDIESWEACAFDNELDYQVFAVTARTFAYFVCIVEHDEQNLEGQSLVEVHIRAGQPGEKNLADLEGLRDGSLLAMHMAFRDRRDPGFLLTLMPDAKEPGRWSASDAMARWPELNLVLSHLAGVAMALRRSAAV